MFQIVVKCHKLLQLLQPRLTFQSPQAAHLQVEGNFLKVPFFKSRLLYFFFLFCSDTDSDFDDVPDTKPVQQKAPSMPSFMDAVSSAASPIQKETKPPPAKSMPQFLNEDLQLSESDDDSD